MYDRLSPRTDKRTVSSCPPPDQIAALASGTLSESERAALASHAEECGECRAELVACFREPIGDPAMLSTAPSFEATSMEIAPGATIAARYKVLRRLGAGAMGVVYAAYDQRLAREVAVKVLRPRDDGDGLRERVEREARAAAQVAHPNVVAAYDTVVDAGQIVVIMELVQGTTLRTYLATRRPWRDILAKLVDAGRGLAAIHAAGLVHRDFKPDNVLVGDDGRVRVTDFGLARYVGDLVRGAQSSSESPLETSNAGFAGTPAYAAPEQHANGNVDALSDQFAFAVTAWEALWGIRPFVEKIGERPATRRSLRGAPPALRTALGRALARDPQHRFASMDGLLVALVRAAGRRRRLAMIGMVASGVALTTGAIAMAVMHEDAAPSCEGLEAPLGPVWGPTVHAAVASRFASSGHPRGRAYAATVGATLDRYAAAWAGTRREVCVATHVRGELAAGQLASAMACLDDRLADLRSFTNALLEADDKVIERAIAASARLPDPDGCRRSTASGSVPEVIAPSVAAVLRSVVALPITTELRGVGVARRELDAIRVRARALGSVSLDAEIALASGSIEFAAGRPTDAISELRQALTLGDRSRNDRIRARAAISLTAALIDQRGWAEAERMAEQARATIDRIGGDPDLELELLTYQARLEAKRGHAAEAVPLFERALAMSNRPDAAIARGEILLAYSDALDSTGRSAEAAAALAQFYALRRSIYGETDHEEVRRLDAEVQVALRAGDLSSARAVGDRAVLAHRELDGEHPDTWVSRRAVYAVDALAGDWSHALALARANVATALAVREPVLEAIALGDVGLAARELGEHATAIMAYRDSLRLASAAGPDGAEASTDAQHGLGVALAAAGQASEAITVLESVMPTLVAMAPAPLAMIASAHASLAEALWARNARGDRVRATGAIQTARETMSEHAKRFTGDGQAAFRRQAEQRLAKFAAWQVAHQLP